MACYTYSLVVVPLYDTLGTEAIGYIIDKGTEATTRPEHQTVAPSHQVVHFSHL